MNARTRARDVSLLFPAALITARWLDRVCGFAYPFENGDSIMIATAWRRAAQKGKYRSVLPRNSLLLVFSSCASFVAEASFHERASARVEG